MDELLAAARSLACHQAIYRFYAALDAADFAAVAAAVAPDGVWHRQGKALRCPGEVAAAMAERPAGRVTAHLVQNLVVTLLDAQTATARYNTLVFRRVKITQGTLVVEAQEANATGLEFENAQWEAFNRLLQLHRSFLSSSYATEALPSDRASREAIMVPAAAASPAAAAAAQVQTAASDVTRTV
jgi:hypothetical protein